MIAFKILFISLGIILLICITIYGPNMELNGEKTFCYDAHRSIITNEVCIVDGSVDTREQAISSSILMGVCSLILFTLMGSVLDEAIGNMMEVYI